MLAALLLAQLFYGVSDREAERRSRVDLSWKDALGLPLEHRGIPHVCLVEFRARVVRAGMAGFFNDKLLSLARRAGVIGHRRVVDSTGIADCVMTMDTVTLISSAMRRCLELLGKLDKRVERTTRASLIRSDYDERGKPQINWSSATEREALVNELCKDAATVIDACAEVDEPELNEATQLLRIVAAQDVEEDGEGGVAIRQGVAPDRVISTVDVDARHGHRSRSDRYDGFKAHLSVDVDSDLITAAAASKATTADHEVLPALLEADPVAIAELIADTHYGHAETRVALVAERDRARCPCDAVLVKTGLLQQGRLLDRLRNQGRDLSCRCERRHLENEQGKTDPGVLWPALHELSPEIDVHDSRGGTDHRDQPCRGAALSGKKSSMDTGVPRPLSRTGPSRTQERSAQVPHAESPLARTREGRCLGQAPIRRTEFGPNRTDAGADRVIARTFHHRHDSQ
jgi:hypothetical protein